MLCHHRQILHPIGKIPNVKGFAGQAVKVERFSQWVQQLFLYLAQIVVKQKGFLSMEEIQSSRLLCL